MHVLVTGASSGIGEAIVDEYVARGATVTMVARRKDRLDAIAARSPAGRTRVVVQDLADHARVPALIDDAEAALGPIDILVNNAGMQIVGQTHEGAWAPGERLLQLNVLTPLRMTVTVLPRMVARKQGCIVDIASMAALAPPAGMFFY